MPTREGGCTHTQTAAIVQPGRRTDSTVESQSSPTNVFRLSTRKCTAALLLYCLWPCSAALFAHLAASLGVFDQRQCCTHPQVRHKAVTRRSFPYLGNGLQPSLPLRYLRIPGRNAAKGSKLPYPTNNEQHTYCKVYHTRAQSHHQTSKWIYTTNGL